MIVEISVGLLLIVLFIFMKYAFIPKRKMAAYKKKLESLGYKVYQIPYNTLGIYSIWLKDQKQKGDARYSMKRHLNDCDVMLTNQFDKIKIQLLTPQLIRQFYTADKQIQYYHKNKTAIQSLSDLFGEGMAFSEGNIWKRKRKIITSVFNFDFLKTLTPKICNLTDSQFELQQKKYFDEHKDQRNNQKINVNIVNLFSTINSNIMVQCFFGSQLKQQKIKGKTLGQFIPQLLNDTFKNIVNPIGIILGAWVFKLGLRKFDRELNQNVRIYRQVCKKVIEQRVNKLKKEGVKQKYQDMVQALTKNQALLKQKQKDSQIYDYNQLIDQFSTFFIGGTDTTTHYLTMIVYYLCINERVMVRVREQINKFIKSDQDITYDKIKQIKYIDWVQKQTTRMYGPGDGIFSRKVKKDHFIQNIPIKAGTLISMHTFGLHYNPLYYKDPFQFRPERWQEQCKKNPSFTLLGFSAGPRNCIGQHLAELETKIMLIKLLRRYKNISIPNQNFKMNQAFLYEPEQMLTELTLN